MASARPTATIRRLVALSFVRSFSMPMMFLDVLIVALLLSFSVPEPGRLSDVSRRWLPFSAASTGLYTDIHILDGSSAQPLVDAPPARRVPSFNSPLRTREPTTGPSGSQVSGLV